MNYMIFFYFYAKNKKQFTIIKTFHNNKPATFEPLTNITSKENKKKKT